MDSSDRLNAVIDIFRGEGSAEGKTRLLDMARSPLDMLVQPLPARCHMPDRSGTMPEKGVTGT